MYNVAERLSCQFNSFGGPPGPLPPVVTLQEAHGPDVNAELLVRATNVHRSHIHNGKSGGFLCPVFKHCLAPVSIGLL